MKVLFHIDQSENWDLTLNNVSNMLAYGKENSTAFEIAIVANGSAVSQLRQTETSDICARLLGMTESVRVCACKNSLKNLRIPLESLPPFVFPVPSGVVEIAVRQRQGYAYIKP